MAFDKAVAAVIQRRLDVVKIIDDSAELSFMESARFRLELFTILKRFETGATNASETLGDLNDLHERVDSVVLAGAGVGIS